jgi:hypothetical protein
MDRRRNPRVGVLLPVRIWGVDSHSLPFSETVTVKNLSASGAVIQGLRRRVKPGEILEVQTGEGKGQFRVIWVGTIGSRSEGEAGLQGLPSEPTIWELNLGVSPQFLATSMVASLA